MQFVPTRCATHLPLPLLYYACIPFCLRFLSPIPRNFDLVPHSRSYYFSQLIDPQLTTNKDRGFISGSANGMNEKEKDVRNKGKFSGVGWNVCQDLRDYAKVSKSDLMIDGQLLVRPRPQ